MQLPKNLGKMVRQKTYWSAAEITKENIYRSKQQKIVNKITYHLFENKARGPEDWVGGIVGFIHIFS